MSSLNTIIACAVAFSCIARTLSRSADGEMLQQKVDFKGNVITYRPGSRRRGDACRNTVQCPRGHCCLRTGYRGGYTCQRNSHLNNRCSDDPAKGQVYHGYCPCVGTLECRRSIYGRQYCMRARGNWWNKWV